MQRFTCTGRLTRAPELRELPGGGTVCKLRLAVDDMARGRDTGYITVSTFGKPGEAAARVESGGIMPGPPLQPARKIDDRLAFAERGRLLRCPHRLPGRQEPA